METRSITLALAIGTLQKTVASNNDESIKSIANEWINKFSTKDSSTTINYDKPEDENRLWFMLEEQKENILSQLESGEETQPEVETEEDVKQSALLDNIGTTLIMTETVKEISQPEPVIESPAPAVQAVVEPKKTVIAPPTASFSVLFAKTQEQAAIFNENLCTAIEAAFNESNSNTVSAFENVLSQIMKQIVISEQNHKQELIAVEERLNRKLEAIYTTTCVAANGAETMAPMYAALEQKNNHSPKF